MTKELLAKFLENKCNPDELNEVIQWIEKDALSDSGKKLGFRDWESFADENVYSSEQNKKLELLLDKVHHKINTGQFAGAHSGRLRISSPVITWMTRAAAILLVPVLSFLIYTLSNDRAGSAKYADMVVDSLEIVAPAGSRIVAQLSDGTSVYLNSGSKLKYPRNFCGKKRELNLSGEGFFEVAHDPEHPFIVKTKNVLVKAMGTKFNVLSYPEDDAVVTTLVEGKVVLEGLIENGKTKTIETLTPGQHIEYQFDTEKALSTRGNIGKYIAWKDGLLVFDNSDINEVAERLGRMFNVKIEVENEIEDYTYTVRFVDESLHQILDLLTKATPVDYTFLPREKLSDGTYSKQKILLRKR